MIRSKQHARAFILIGLVLIISFKIWKYYLRAGMGLSPSDDYLQYETLSTVFRFINSILAIGICAWGYTKFKDLIVGENRKAPAILVAYVIAYLLIRLLFNNFIGAPNFTVELAFNLFTGISEEFLFRGLILAGLWHFVGFWPACVLSSLIFSAWHFDVGGGAFNYISLFFASLVYCLGFGSRAGLLILCAVHFIWDQIFYGLHWALPTSFSEKILVIGLDIIVVILLKKSSGFVARLPGTCIESSI